MEVTIRDDFIKLGQVLKLASVVQEKKKKKYVIQEGKVKVNGEVDLRRGRKIYPGDIVTFGDNEITVTR